MSCVSFTAEVSQSVISPLNLLAAANRPRMFVTLDVCHSPRFSLNIFCLRKISFISVTSLVSHARISPYSNNALQRLSIHPETAERKFWSVTGVNSTGELAGQSLVGLAVKTVGSALVGALVVGFALLGALVFGFTLVGVLVETGLAEGVFVGAPVVGVPVKTGLAEGLFVGSPAGVVGPGFLQLWQQISEILFPSNTFLLHFFLLSLFTPKYAQFLPSLLLTQKKDSSSSHLSLELGQFQQVFLHVDAIDEETAEVALKFGPGH
mmetsp:Transcript_16895/g.33633  ORF Transcript_16895/g.33633 Transcript_16895/m.33633 type:complete len:265 (+) Transcript_16895:490-1284(+)